MTGEKLSGRKRPEIGQRNSRKNPVELVGISHQQWDESRMKLYDDLIADCYRMLSSFSYTSKNYFPETITGTHGGKAASGADFSALGADLWEQEDEQRILFKKDTAYELGGGNLPAYSGTAFTSDRSVKGEIIVCGPDLPKIKADSPYARLTILCVDDSAWEDNEQAYRVMRRLDYTRYHVYPKGFSMRISAAAHREPVRIGREALKAGLDFEQVGKLFLNAYYSHPEVLGARIFFITEPDFPHEEFGKAVCRMESVTESLNEIFNNLIMDCAACKLKSVCDEVEGLRELHFAVQKDIPMP